MKLGRIVDERFHTALAKLSTEPLPLKTAFKIKGISKSVRDEYAKYEECRQAALKNHGLKKEDGELDLDEKNNVKFDQDGMMAFAKDMSDLTSLDLDIPTVKLSELGDKLALTALELELLDGILVED